MNDRRSEAGPAIPLLATVPMTTTSTPCDSTNRVIALGSPQVGHASRGQNDLSARDGNM